MINDQAMNLRQALLNSRKNDPEFNSECVNTKLEQEGRAKIICVSSGKGGVGKSNFTVNLSLELSNRNKKVIIIDADFGLANVELLMGVVSKKNFLDLVADGEKIENIITKINDNLGFISGGAAITELANLDNIKLGIFLNKIEEITNDADYIIIDTGAGISNVVTDFIGISDELIVITSCEPTSVTDAYALIKSINKKGNNLDISVVVNMAENEEEANHVFGNMDYVCKKFMKRSLNYLGPIFMSTSVPKAVKRQVAFLEMFPYSKTSKCIKSIASKIDNSLEEKEEKEESIILKFMKMLGR